MMNIKHGLLEKLWIFFDDFPILNHIKKTSMESGDVLILSKKKSYLVIHPTNRKLVGKISSP